LWLVWSAGVEAGPLLEAVAARFGRAERRRLSQAAARLGVYLMAPLGLCYLPAFVALGLVPIMLSLAGSLVQVM
jgi:pilus assembly protein TadC